MIRRALTLVTLGMLGALSTGAPAVAHPLGDFTTNQYSGLRVTSTGVDVDFVLDLAEIPAYQARTTEIDTDRDGTGSPAENDAYAGRTCAAAAAAGTVAVDGAEIPLTAEPAGLTFPASTGGLTILRLRCVLHADAAITTTATVDYRTTLYAERIGWREITAVGDRYTIVESDVPGASVSALLTAYPAGVISSDIRTATLTVRPGGAAAAAPFADAPFGSAPFGTAPFAAGEAAQARDTDRLTAWFSDLIGHPELTLGIGVLAFLVAVVLGGAHAVAPGHGKTIMAAYMIGSRGRLREALTVAATVAATHTLGVLALGVVFATSLQLAPDTMYGWLRLISGVVVALVGSHLLYQALHRRRAPQAHPVPAGQITPHAHPHSHEPHAHPHPHEPHAHPHEPHAHAHPHEPHTHAHPHEPHAHAHPDEPLTHPNELHTHAHPHEPHAHALHAHAALAPQARTHTPHPHAPHDHKPHTHAHAPHTDEHPPRAHEHAPHDHEPHDHALHTHESHAHEPHAPLVHEHEHGGRRHVHHLPEPGRPLRVHTLLAMGFAGGLSPSPSAVVVLLGAAALGRAWYGVLLVLAYGIGLAATLTGIGFALAHWGERLHRLNSGRWNTLLSRQLPTATAAVIMLAGLGMVLLALPGLL